MKEYVFIGPCPCDENCAQVGSDNYADQARKECRAYINQLWRWLKTKGITQENAPESFSITTKSESHDYGTYYEVAFIFDDRNETAMNLAYDLESEVPTNWDCEAKKELGL